VVRRNAEIFYGDVRFNRYYQKLQIHHYANWRNGSNTNINKIYERLASSNDKRKNRYSLPIKKRREELVKGRNF